MQEVPHHVQDALNMRDMLRTIGRSPYLELVLNHDSMGHTVQNMAAVVFFMNLPEPRVVVSHDAVLGLVFTHVDHLGQPEAGGNALQFVADIDQASWLAMCQVVPCTTTCSACGHCRCTLATSCVCDPVVKDG
jgi:Nse4 C-terminal